MSNGSGRANILVLAVIVLSVLVLIWFGTWLFGTPKPAEKKASDDRDDRIVRAIDDLRKAINPPPGTPVGPSAKPPTPPAPAPVSIESRVQAVEDGLKSEISERKAADAGLTKICNDQTSCIGKLAENVKKLEAYIGQVDHIATGALYAANTNTERIGALVEDLSGVQNGVTEIKAALMQSIKEENDARARLERRQNELEAVQRQAKISEASPFVRTARLAENRALQAQQALDRAAKELERKEAERQKLEERIRQLERPSPAPPVSVEYVAPPARRAILPWNR